MGVAVGVDVGASVTEGVVVGVAVGASVVVRARWEVLVEAASRLSREYT